MSRVIKEDIERIVSEFREELRSLSGQNILITGGNGFIASYLVDTFARINAELERPCKVFVMNKNPIDRNSRLSHLVLDPNIEFITQDVGRPFNPPKGLDIIVHAASRSNPTLFLQDPIDTINANVNGVRTLLEYCRENKVRNFLFFSSAEVYGDNPPKEFILIPETYPGCVDPLGKKACYSESKRFAETLCNSFYNQFQVPTKILRIFHTYGPGLRDDGKAIIDFFKQGLKKAEINLKDQGGARIAFCYVSDLTRGILRVMFDGNCGEAYNIGNNSELYPIREIAETIGGVLNNGTKVNINKDAPESANIVVRAPDLKKINGIGYFPETTLRQGFERMKNHYEEVGRF